MRPGRTELKREEERRMHNRGGKRVNELKKKPGIK